MSAQARAEEGRATGAGEGGGGASAEEGHRRWRHDDAAVRGEGRRRQHEDWGRRSGGGGKIGEDLAEEEEGNELYRQGLWYRVRTSPGANGCLRHRFLYHPVPL